MLPTKGCHIAHTVRRSLRTVSKNYAAAAIPLTEALDDEVSGRHAHPVDSQVKITTLNNGIKVASSDSGGGVSRISIATNAGSRHESSSQLGLTHLMKNCAFLTNTERSTLRTVREVQEVGGSLECETSREFQTRNASFLRNKLPEVMENIAPGMTKPVFNHWDVNDAKNHCDSENITVAGDHCAVNLELLHKAAYRSGLGNSLYCHDLRIGSFSSEQLEEFVATNYVGDRITIVGSDVSHDELVGYAKELYGNLPRGNAQTTAQQKYHGGEMHLHTDNNLTYASLVAEGASVFNADLASFIVLQKMLGTGPYVKWGSNTSSSRLNKAAQAVTDGPLSINALNISYSDSGLFGFNVITTPDAITPVLKAAVGQISSVAKGEASAEEFERAKTQAAAGVGMLCESKGDLLEDMMKQVALSGSYASPADALAKIHQVTQDNVLQVAKKLLSGKSSLVITGNALGAPYVDELL